MLLPLGRIALTRGRRSPALLVLLFALVSLLLLLGQQLLQIGDTSRSQCSCVPGSATYRANFSSRLRCRSSAASCLTYAAIGSSWICVGQCQQRAVVSLSYLCELARLVRPDLEQLALFVARAVSVGLGGVRSVPSGARPTLHRQHCITFTSLPSGIHSPSVGAFRRNSRTSWFCCASDVPRCGPGCILPAAHRG